MTDDTASRIAVSPAGKPGRAWLELRGSILIFRRESWVTSASVYIPLEWVAVSERSRLDWRRLWRAIIAFMSAFLFALPLSLYVRVLRPYEDWDLPIAAILAFFLCLTAGIGCWQLWKFPRHRNVCLFTVVNQGYGMDIAFWYEPGEDPALDALIASVRAGREKAQSETAYPMRMNHMWYRPKPYRIALLKGAGISLCLAMIIMLLESLRSLGYPLTYSRWLLVFAAAPALFYLLAEAARRGPLSRRPLAYRMAHRAYLRGDLGMAQECLAELLREQPGFAEGRLLMVQACAEDCAFESALEHCAKLAEDHPLLASRLQATVWSLRRIHDRMQ